MTNPTVLDKTAAVLLDKYDASENPSAIVCSSHQSAFGQSHFSFHGCG